jgi:hypothetical protein
MSASFRSGSSYTIEELADLVRSTLEQKDMTYRNAARSLAKQDGKSLRSTEAQISMALSSPAQRPGMVLRLVELVSDYEIEGPARYTIRRK